MTTRVAATTMRVDDLDAAARDIAAALDTEFITGRHPTFDVEMAASPVVTLVASSTVDPGDGPLVEIAFAVDDPTATAAALAANGVAVRRVGATGSARHVFELHGLPMAIDTAGSSPQPNGPVHTRLDRAVLVVDDIREAASDVARLLGIELSVFDVDNMRISVALGEQGLELIARLDPVIDMEATWHGSVAGFAVQVHDLDRRKAAMAELGVEVSYEFTTAGGMLEVFYGRPGLWGIPTTLVPFHQEGGLIAAMGLEDGADASPTIR